jgi:chorismate synthase
MRANKYCGFLGFTTFGESHGPAMGLVIEDVKPGIVFPEKEINLALLKRKGNKNFTSTSRNEPDEIKILSGVFKGKTTGMPICILIYNKDVNSNDYKNIENIFRPGHADFSYFNKFKIYDYRGGGRASGRETISRVAASEMVNHLLNGIDFIAYPIRIGEFVVNNISYSFMKTNHLNWSDKGNYSELISYLKSIKDEQDSVGSIIRFEIKNVPVGLGDPVFEKLDANIAKAILSIGSVKGIQFGVGFSFGKMKGSESNDEMKDGDFISNNSGGILGGISTGQNIYFDFVSKPVPSIGKTQNTIDSEGNNRKIEINGRHDLLLTSRIIPVAISMIKLVLSDAISYQKLIENRKNNLNDFREQLEKIDEDILIAIARRNEISKFIGNFKKENKIKIQDKNQEQKVIELLKNKANHLKINEDIIPKIWNELFKESKRQQ